MIGPMVGLIPLSKMGVRVMEEGQERLNIPGIPYPPRDEVDPDADSLTEAQVSAAVAAGLSKAGIFASSGTLNRDNFDVDVGMHEFFKVCLAMRAGSVAFSESVIDHVGAAKTVNAELLTNTKAVNAELVSNARAINSALVDHLTSDASAFYGAMRKSTANDQAALAEQIKWESDNEVLSTATLTAMVRDLNSKFNTVLEAIGAIPQLNTAPKAG